MINYIRKKAI